MLIKSQGDVSRIIDKYLTLSVYILGFLVRRVICVRLWGSLFDKDTIDSLNLRFNDKNKTVILYRIEYKIDSSKHLYDNSSVVSSCSDEMF